MNEKLIFEGINGINRVLMDMSIHQIEGNIFCIQDPRNEAEAFIPKRFNLQYLSSVSNTVCEIGVNAGHSILFMLAANPELNLTLFDLGFHPYTEPCVEYIKSLFPNSSIQITYGDSRETLTKFSQENKKCFDFIHVDGGHETDVLSSDWKNSLELIKDNGIIVVDDTNYENIYNYVHDRIDDNEVIVFNHQNIIPNIYHVALKKVAQNE